MFKMMNIDKIDLLILKLTNWKLFVIYSLGFLKLNGVRKLVPLGWFLLIGAFYLIYKTFS